MHTIFFAQNLLGPETVKTRQNNKNSGFSGNCPKPKMTPLFWKRVFFSMGEKVIFTNCVFAKLCHSIFLCFQQNTAVAVKQMYVEKQKIYEKLWVGSEHVKTVFLFAFFQVSCFCVFVVLLFVCLVRLQKCKKCLLFVFPVLGAFEGWHTLVYLGLEGLGVFVFLLLFLFRFCLCLFCSVCVLLMDCFWRCSCFFVFFFLGGGSVFFWRGGGCFCLFLLFCFVCDGFVVFVFLVFLLLSFFSFLLFCYLCFLEWSRCCSCFVIFGLFRLYLSLFL